MNPLTSRWGSSRKMARHEANQRAQAAETARTLAVALHHDVALPVQPYTVGLVLWQGEQPWAEVAARCSADTTAMSGQGQHTWTCPPLTEWLVSSYRVAGRFANGVIRWWTWEEVVGEQLDLTPGHEVVQLDIDGQQPVWWTGAGLAPLAVAAVYRLHGSAALVDHPGLGPLRTTAMTQQPPPRRGELRGPGAPNFTR